MSAVRPGRLAWGLLAALAILPYVNALPYGYTYDDKPIIRDNERLAAPARAATIFATPYWGTKEASAREYRPVTLLSYAVQRWAGAGTPAFLRAGNVLLHAGATLLFALWLLAIGVPAAPAFAGAALFAVAPIHVEAVTSLVGRAEALAAFFLFGAALLWRRATAGRERPAPLAYAGSLLFFTLALFSKESAVVFPGVVLLGDLAGEGTPPGPRVRLAEWSRAKWLAFAALSGPVALLLVARRLVLGSFVTPPAPGTFLLENPLLSFPPLLRAANAAWLQLRYAAKTLVPFGLAADHSAFALPLAESLLAPRAFAGIAGLVLLAAAAVVAFRRRPGVTLGILLFLGAFFPASNLLVPIGTVYAERLAYLPSAGLALALASLLVPPSAASRGVPRAALAAVGALVLVYGIATAARNRVWRDDATLYADTVARMPGSAKAHYNMAEEARREGRAAEARAEYERAVAIYPKYQRALERLGELAWEAERGEEALALFRRAIAADPGYDEGWMHLAVALRAMGRRDEARRAYDDGVSHAPRSYILAFERADFLESEGLLEEAEREWRRAVELGNGVAVARLSHALVLEKLGRSDEAMAEAAALLREEPGFVRARFFRALVLERTGKRAEAFAELVAARAARPDDPIPASKVLEFGLRHPEEREAAAGHIAGIVERFGNPPADRRLAGLVAAYLR